MRYLKFIPVIAVLISSLVCMTSLQAESAATTLTQFSLEELMNMEVTSVSRTSQPLNQTAAAIYIINEEQIRRSSATKVPELLRMVPGLQVAQISASDWAITARGFNGALANKLLVMIDGRTVYSHLHNGVYWDVQDLFLEDIERIEVIRGPGASVWGANAVNGVINIITKHTKNTKGTVLKGWGGSHEQGTGARFGGKTGENFYYRGSGKFFNTESTFKGNDAWHMSRGGFRSDWQADPNDSLTFQGDYYNGVKDDRVTEVFEQNPFRMVRPSDTELAGGNFLTRWNHVYSPTSDSSLQIYYDQTNRQNVILDEIRYSADIDWQHRFWAGDRNEIVWGLGYRLLADRTKGSFAAFFDPSQRADNLWQAFLQDTITLVPARLWLTLGSKFEINPYTDFEFQPTARMLWQFHEHHSVWTAVSRAVRTPSRLDHDLVIQGWLTQGSNLGIAEGNPDMKPESLVAYEAGYRGQLHKRISLDVAAFINRYRNLRTLFLNDTFTRNGYDVTRYFLGNYARARTFGAELESKIHVLETLRFGLGYTFLRMIVRPGSDAFNTSQNGEKQNPDHQLFFKTYWNPIKNVEIDPQIRYVDALKNFRISAYWEMDLHVAWHVTKNLELSVIGQNLFHNHHMEFSSATSSGINRAVYGKATLKFD